MEVDKKCGENQEESEKESEEKNRGARRRARRRVGSMAMRSNGIKRILEMQNLPDAWTPKGGARPPPKKPPLREAWSPRRGTKKKTSTNILLGYTQACTAIKKRVRTDHTQGEGRPQFALLRGGRLQM